MFVFNLACFSNSDCIHNMSNIDTDEDMCDRFFEKLADHIILVDDLSDSKNFSIVADIASSTTNNTYCC